MIHACIHISTLAFAVIVVCPFYYIVLFVEFKESSYSVVEDDSIFNVTLVKQGNLMQDILVFIIPIPGIAKCKQFLQCSCIIISVYLAIRVETGLGHFVWVNLD